MILNDLITDLSRLDLFSTNFIDDTTGILDASYIPRAVSSLNAALRNLYGRFPIQEKEITVQSRDWQSIYPLKPENAYTNKTQAEKYIVDTERYPFTGDILCITQVTNEIGEILPLNDANQYASVFTPDHQTLQLTHVGFNQAFFVTYRVVPVRLEYDASNSAASLAQEFLLPVALETAVRYFVASAFFDPMGGKGDTQKRQEYEALFQQECNNVENQGTLGQSEMDTNVKLMLRNFP